MAVFPDAANFMDRGNAHTYSGRDPEGTMFPARKWITYLEVVLDDRGYLKSTKVIRPSGLDFLDRAAVDAFRGGSPFLNPPSGLVENGEIRFAQGFVVDMTGLVDYLRHPRRRCGAPPPAMPPSPLPSSRSIEEPP
jgi:hypothetical protein